MKDPRPGRPTPPRRAALTCLLLAAALGSPARALECPVPAEAAPSLRAIPAEQRLAFLRGGLGRAARRARIWSYAWMAFYGAAATGQLALSPAFPRAARIDLYVGGAASALGFGAQLVLPLKTIADQRRLEARLDRAPRDADPCGQLADAERVLARDAASEHEGLSPLLHGASFLVNIAGGLVIGLVGGRWPQALLQIFVGSAIGEATLLTQPTETVALLRRYRAAELAPRRVETRLPFALAPSLGPGRIGLDLAVSF